MQQFRHWYTQAGTPVVRVQRHYDPGARTYALGSGLKVKRDLFEPLRFPRRPKEVVEAVPTELMEQELASLDDLKAQPRERIAGRIVFFTNRMERSRDGSGYGKTVPARSSGAAEAASLGAVAMVMRPAGTSVSRTPHTGGQRYANGIPPIPAFALSNPDADLLEQQLASGQPVRVRLSNTSRWEGEAQTANVIGEIPGRGLEDEVVLLGAHLDSWDLGTGALDDATGVGVVTAARCPARLRQAIDVAQYVARAAVRAAGLKPRGARAGGRGPRRASDSRR